MNSNNECGVFNLKQLKQNTIMKTILITLITATVALGNSLPPCPQNTLPPTWDLVPKEHASWELVSQDDFEITPHLEA